MKIREKKRKKGTLVAPGLGGVYKRRQIRSRQLVAIKRERGSTGRFTSAKNKPDPEKKDENTDKPQEDPKTPDPAVSIDKKEKTKSPQKVGKNNKPT